jgi:hypothetical protein
VLKKTLKAPHFNIKRPNTVQLSRFPVTKKDGPRFPGPSGDAAKV